MNIPIIYHPGHNKHNPPFEIYDGIKESYAEKAARLESIIQALRLAGVVDIRSPRRFPMRHILSLHKKSYVDFLRSRSAALLKDEVLYPSYFIMDTYTPIVQATYSAARLSADIALTGAELVRCGCQAVYSLCRPPGHHAENKVMGGYCYFNNAAIAANFLSNYGKVAILDIDFHHGNGTQQLFYERKDVLYVSLHADPRVRFPYGSGLKEERGSGLGEGFTINYPLPLGTDNKAYLRNMRKALRDIQRFNPSYLVVSAGFDTYEKDPIGGFSLTIPFYETIGREIASLRLPTLYIQEGGYAVNDLGAMAVNLMKGVGLLGIASE